MKYNRGFDKNIEVNEEVSEYIKSLLFSSESISDNALFKQHDSGDRAYLHIPFSQAKFLEVYAKAIGAKKVLEIGTFKGFSTAFLARAVREKGGEVVTIDEDTRYVAEAELFWKKMKVKDTIQFMLGLAETILKKMNKDNKYTEYFDLIFIDADKENYKKYLELSIKLLRKGGSILVDNTLWRGLPAEKNITDNGAKHIKAFNEWVFNKYKKQVSMVPSWDGLTIIVKK